MSDIWQFSSFSKPLVQKLLQTAVTLENNNEWSERFGHLKQRSFDDLKLQKQDKQNVSVDQTEQEPCLLQNTDAVIESVEEKPIQADVIDENFINTIESEPLCKFEYMIEECLKRPNLITQLAENLTITAIEKICNKLFTEKEINIDFISIFLQRFFTSFLKREQSWIGLDLLVKANKSFPDAFESVLIILIKDVNIKNTVLQELIQNSSEEYQKHFITVVLHLNITSDMFVHHLYTLYIVYKDCTKSKNVQNFFQTKLIENAIQCVNDKNYGRLFLTYLQVQKRYKYSTDISKLEQVLEQHMSPFKRPCLNLLNEIREQLNDT